jgi:tetratricopeptide (TPR) repeat protein
MNRHVFFSWLAALMVALTVSGTASMAHAGEQEARQLNKKAKAAYGQGDFKRAAELLEQAYNEDPNVVYQYNRVRALEGAEEFDLALSVLAKYRDEMRKEGYSDLKDLKETLESKRERKMNQSNGSGASTTDSSGGQTQTPGAMSNPSGPTGPSGPATDSGGVQPTPLTWALFGIGGAGLLSGGLMSTGLFVDKDNQDAVRTQQLTAAILLGTGALAGVGGGLTLLLNKKSSGSARGLQSPRTPHTPSVGVAPMVTPKGGGGAILHIQF